MADVRTSLLTAPLASRPWAKLIGAVALRSEWWVHADSDIVNGGLAFSVRCFLAVLL